MCDEIRTADIRSLREDFATYRKRCRDCGYDFPPILESRINGVMYYAASTRTLGNFQRAQRVLMFAIEHWHLATKWATLSERVNTDPL